MNSREWGIFQADRDTAIAALSNSDVGRISRDQMKSIVNHAISNIDSWSSFLHLVMDIGLVCHLHDQTVEGDCDSTQIVTEYGDTSSKSVIINELGLGNPPVGELREVLAKLTLGN